MITPLDIGSPLWSQSVSGNENMQAKEHLLAPQSYLAVAVDGFVFSTAVCLTYFCYCCITLWTKLNNFAFTQLHLGLMLLPLSLAEPGLLLHFSWKWLSFVRSLWGILYLSQHLSHIFFRTKVGSGTLPGFVAVLRHWMWLWDTLEPLGPTQHSLKTSCRL